MPQDKTNRILIGCVEYSVPEGGYVSPLMERCTWCECPLVVGRRVSMMIESHPERYALACLTCLPVMLGIDEL